MPRGSPVFGSKRNVREPMRVAFVAHSYRPALGGVQTHVEQLARGLTARGHEAEVLVHRNTPTSPPVEVVDRVLVRRFPVLGNFQHYALAPGMARYLKRSADRFDVIHAHNYQAFPAAAAALVDGAPLVFTPHYHGVGGSTLRTLLHRPYRLFASPIFRRAAVVIAVSPAEAELFATHFPWAREKIVVIPNGVDAQSITAAQPYEGDWDRVVLSVGRLKDYKRVDMTVRALQHLDEGYVLCIIGEGDARAALQRLVEELQLERRVRFLGSVPGDDLYRWLRTADVHVTMSEVEAMGITVLEALSAGANVVASDIPAHRGIAAFGGDLLHLMPSDASPVALAEAIAGGAAREGSAENVPSWDDVLDRTLRVYEQAATLPPSVPE